MEKTADSPFITVAKIPGDLYVFAALGSKWDKAEFAALETRLPGVAPIEEQARWASESWELSAHWR